MLSPLFIYQLFFHVLKKLKRFGCSRIISSFALNNCLKHMFKETNNSEVKDRILLVARDLFIEKGYNGTSIRDIATASGTNVAMVNYYFRSKYNLFEIIFEEALEALVKRVFGVFKSDMSIFELVEAWINSYYETLMEYPQIPIFILNEINQNPERLTQRIKEHAPNELFRYVSDRIKKEIEKGTIRDLPPLDFLLNVLSLCVFPFMFGVLATKVANKSMQEYHEVLIQHKDYVVEFVINAIKP